MTGMVLARRDFIKAAGAGFLAALLPRQAAALANAELVFASSCQRADGRFAAVLVSETGNVISTLDLPGRGHDVTQCPVTKKLVVFARRPGTFALVFDTRGHVIASIATPAGRHFYGHGVFSNDGKLLYATENDFENARGIIRIYDATADFTRIGEFFSGRVGPHDILLTPAGQRMIVANGGIETHPDYGREKLNLADMKPNIAVIDCDNGGLLGVHDLPAELHKLSLRHMAAGENGAVWIGAQYQGDAAEKVPLIAKLTPGESLAFPEFDDKATAMLANYIGSVASTPDGQYISFTSPVGNSALILDSRSMQVELISRDNVCGVAMTEPDPVLSTGNGEFHPANAEWRRSDVLFDHHMLPVAAG